MIEVLCVLFSKSQCGILQPSTETHTTVMVDRSLDFPKLEPFWNVVLDHILEALKLSHLKPTSYVPQVYCCLLHSMPQAYHGRLKRMASSKKFEL